MAITGPLIQMPVALTQIVREDGTLKQEWASFFHSLQQTVFNLTRSGETASRPTSAMEGRWIGMPYYDTDLGFPIFLASVNPDVWHDATGAPA